MEVKKARGYKIWSKLKSAENRDATTVALSSSGREGSRTLALVAILGVFMGKVEFKGEGVATTRGRRGT